MKKKIVIIGFGSAGQRHYDSLKKIKNVKILILTKIRKFNFLSKLSALKSINPDYFVISTPTSEHYSIASFIEKNFKGKKILIEKPLFHKYKNFNARNNTFYVGYQLRFHPIIDKLRRISDDEKILNVNIICNSYLPLWRKRDYELSYSSKKKEGGGVLLDLSHELDFLQWTFPHVKYKYIFKTKLSSLKINTDDICTISGFDKLNKFPFQINLSYFSKANRRLVIVDTERFTFTGNLFENYFEIHYPKRKIHRKYKKFNSKHLTYLMHKSILTGRGAEKLSSLNSGKLIMKSINQLEKLNKKNNKNR